MRQLEGRMAERKINFEEGQEEESSPLILKTQTYADLRQLAKKNLKEAERVLAESGHQLFKNKKVDTDLQGRSLEETSQESKEEKRED
jgi:hypothetical protein